MAAKPKTMHQVRQIIEWHQKGKSIREIKRLTGISRQTIRHYLNSIKALHIPPEHLLGMEDEPLRQLFCGEENLLFSEDERYDVLKRQMKYLAAELTQRGVTRQLLWEEYRKEHPDGYGYSQFCEHLGRYLQRNQAVMHFTHQRGEQMQVDFAGDKLSYVDPHTGEVIACEVLVCVLPYSHYTFVRALHSQKQEDFIGGICRALEYFGGVPQSIKSDNLRSAVIHSNKYEPKFTEAMEYLGAHYGTTILAARVRKPRDKASVEKAVDLSYKRIYAPMRHQVFHSIEELNAAILNPLKEYNNRLFKGRDYSRSKLLEEEKPFLKELPATRYEMKKVTWGKVQKNYHVIVGEDWHQYSVPYTLIGKKLKIVYTFDTVEVYDTHTRVALHSRSRKRYGYTTRKEHMPENHRHVYARQGWDAAYFEKQASAVGNATLTVIKKVLTSQFFHEQTYNSCLGILRLGKQYTNERLEAACSRALLSSSRITYRTLSDILKHNLDKQPTLFDESAPIPKHDQIRGPSVYQ